MNSTNTTYYHWFVIGESIRGELYVFVDSARQDQYNVDKIINESKAISSNRRINSVEDFYRMVILLRHMGYVVHAFTSNVSTPRVMNKVGEKIAIVMNMNEHGNIFFMKLSNLAGQYGFNTIVLDSADGSNNTYYLLNNKNALVKGVNYKLSTYDILQKDNFEFVPASLALFEKQELPEEEEEDMEVSDY
jgi:hypothetical protein